MRKYSLMMTIFMLAFAFGCDDGKRSFKETVTVVPVTPLATVGGVVFDAGTDGPLAGVEVMVISGGSTYTAVTDDNGIFQVNNIPAVGGVLVLYSSPGFLPARIQGEFPVAPGNVPYEYSTLTLDPVWMINSSGTLQVRLLDPNGQPLSQVALQLSIPASYFTMDTWGNMYYRGDLHRVANTNANGLAQFRDIPELPLAGGINFPTARVYVPEIDINGDGNPEYASTTRNFDLHHAAGTIQVIRLSHYATGDLTVLASNNSYFTSSPTVPGTFNSGDTMYVVFNREPDPDTLYAELREFESNGASWELTVSRLGTQVNFKLPNDLVAGQMYLLTLFAHARDFGNSYQRTVPVFIHTDAPLTLSMERENTSIANSPVIVTFNQWVGTGSQFYTSLNLQNGVVYFVYDLNSTGIIGDDWAEYGFQGTNVAFASMEERPTWVPNYATNLTGFSNKWRFQPPATAVTGTTVQFPFPYVMDQTYVFRTPGGVIVQQMAGPLP